MSKTRLKTVLLCVVLSVAARPSFAATLSVCASGCAYSDFQAALNAAAQGDTILLRAGETFAGNFKLPAKAGTGWITIRSDAPDAQLPASGVRLVPSGRTGANTSRSLLPRLVGLGGALKTTAVIRTVAGAHHYRLQFIEVDGFANVGFEPLVQIGENTPAAPATDIVLDRVYLHGHPTKGQKRGVTLNGARLEVQNSYISDIKAVNADSQGILSYNGTGPFKIVNNYIEAAAENILFGGADPAITNLVPSDALISRNHLYKPMSWRSPILSTPGSPSLTAATGGSLASGTHYFKVVALLTSGDRTAVSLPSAERSVSVGGSGAVKLTWSGVSGAERYRIYRGTTAGGQSKYLETSGSSTSFTYLGSGESAGTPPKAGTLWVVKNLFEVKNGQRLTVDGNLMENNWQAGQFGYAIVLTPENSEGRCTWCAAKDLVFTNNIVRHSAGAVNAVGHDARGYPSGRGAGILFRNNLFDDIDGAKYNGPTVKAVLLGMGVSNVTFDRNTWVHMNSSLIYGYGSEQDPGFKFTNNSARHQQYGIMGEGSSPGIPTLNKFFPSAVVTCNALAGGPASSYPSSNVFPTVAQWTATFANFAGGDYTIAAPATITALGCSAPGGADMAAITNAIQGASFNPPPPPPPPPPSTNLAPTAKPGGPYSATAGVAVSVNGSGSTDGDGTIASYRWSWGDDVLVRAADVPASALHGSAWVRASVSDAAGGVAVDNPDKGGAKVGTALAAPSSYVEFAVRVAAGVPYRLWVRSQAESNSYSNDSMYVQFSGAVDANGAALYRIGSTQAAAIVLQDSLGAGISGWGWNDAAYGAVAPPIYFAQSGLQTIRIQQREDGIMWDQLLLSGDKYRSASPGAVRADATILPATLGTSSGVTASHVYAGGGAFPLTLTVVDNAGAAGAASTVVNVAGSGAPAAAAAVTAAAGGPYAGPVGAAVAFDGRASVVPSGTTAQYAWQFGDDVVIHASDFSASNLHGAWAQVSDASAADGVLLENANAGAAKVTTPAANPANYVEATFRVAAGVPYRLWIRMRAIDNSYSNDSIWVQFSGSTTAAGATAYRIGSTSALGVVLEEGMGAGMSGWGWADASYGGLADPIYFNADGTQTIRIQQREDGVRIDQIVLSANRWDSAAPGATIGDATIVPTAPAAAQGAQVQHVYPLAGSFPVTLTVKTSEGSASDTATATIK